MYISYKYYHVTFLDQESEMFYLGWCYIKASQKVEYFVEGVKCGMGWFIQGVRNGMGCFVWVGKSLLDVLSGVSKNGMGCSVPGCFVRLPY